ncbi:DUF3422 domain-containing protein [Crenobacter sp. SG2303]|uniref:DUF3422 domain-containing protein n=1 Tax=Crenobacter oryzisoli TaxID=3056844 RepID=A0ABT7XTK1_9NEIS|nr:DUF3422 domain-containing protein [Crenobacter sp. SG2303]MDN0077132.1 DUF3422 domain-containing protein [Crenobacter sp. SG2303]
MTTLVTHPLRRSLNDEAHARPPAAIASPARVSSFTVLFEKDDSGQREAIARLAEHFGIAPPAPTASHFDGQAGELAVRWSLHNEFARYTLVRPGIGPLPFVDTAFAELPDDWLASLPGTVMVALHTVVLPAGEEQPVQEIAQRWFGGRELLGAEIGDGNGAAYTDLRLHPDPRLPEGFSRFVIVDRKMGPNQTGRMVQRLFEIETYRMLALLALPIAKQQMREINELGGILRRVTERMTEQPDQDDDLLAELTELAARAERLVGEHQYRFSASRAYYQLIAQRIAELRERRMPGLQPFREFMERRLAPAMATCETALGRQDRLIERIQRTTALLRTRVEVMHEQQNRALLASMDRRAELQLRLQETVEGLSVGVLTYYAVSLTGYIFKALHAGGVEVNPELATGLAIVPIALSVWLLVQRAKKFLGH